MSIIQRYILAEFTKLLAISLLAFISLFLVVDLFENMDDLLRHNVPVGASISFFLYKIPFIIGQTAPIAILVSVLLSLGLLAKHGEVTAIKAGGMRLLSAVMPLFAAGLIISIGIILMNESITPAAMRKTASFKNHWFDARTSSFGHGGMWLRTPTGIFNIMHMDLKKNELRAVTLYVLDRDFTVTGRISSNLVRFDGVNWVADEAFVWTFSSGSRPMEGRKESGLVIPGLMDPVELSDYENIERNMSIRELSRYIGNIEEEGYDASKYRLDMYCKLSFPLVSFVMVLVGIPFALRTGRHGGIAAGVGISVIIAFSYWVVFALSKALGGSGMVPPIAAAVFPDVLFLAVGAFMLAHVRE